MPDTPVFDSLSVIIPTYNREKVLAKALEAYLVHTSPQQIHELLVVDDGSTDGTESMVSEFGRRSPFPIRYFRQPNRGPGTARNLGIREARSNVILLTDSDIIPEHDLVAEHLEWHKRNPQIEAAVLGYVTWSPEIEATPFMRWYGEDGALFRYRSLRGRTGEVGCHFFYTCNLSLKTEFLRTRGQFDEDFKGAGYEDLELGYRLNKLGMKLLYNSAAIGYHYQRFSFEEACRKTRANVASAQLFFGKEAGQQLLQEVQQARSGARYTITEGIAKAVAKLFSPARRLLDSSFPLPRIVYHLFYWYDATRVLMANAVENRLVAKPVDKT
jgi:glycosyltransferase involved in cell wall biosynthesis